MFVAKDLRPMLATLPARPPALTVAGFVYEPKYDGIRAIVEVVPGADQAAVRLWSRTGNEKTAQFPDIVDAVGQWGRGLPGTVVLDGEVTALIVFDLLRDHKGADLLAAIEKLSQ